MSREQVEEECRDLEIEADRIEGWGGPYAARSAATLREIAANRRSFHRVLNEVRSARVGVTLPSMGDPAQKLPSAEPNEALHEQGLREWFEGLPADDWTDALNEDELTPVRWDGVTFVEVGA